MKQRKKRTGTKLDRFRMSIRDPKVKINNSTARDLLEQARTDFSPFTWSTVLPLLYQVKAQSLRFLLPRKVEYWGQLQLSMPLKAMTLQEELLWCAACLSQNISVLRDFGDFARKFESAFLLGQGDKCKEILREIKGRCGYSLWLIRAKINCAATFEGLESQKEAAREIIHENPRSLTSFLSWYVSERNEEKVSMAGFSRRINETMIEADAPLASKLVLSRELLNELPVDVFGLQQLLASYASNSVIDYYECALDVLQRVSSGPRGLVDMFDSFEDVISAFQGLMDDKRIAAIREDIFDEKREDLIESESIFTVEKYLGDVDYWGVSSVLRGWCPMLESQVASHVKSALVDHYHIVTRSSKRDEVLPRFEKYFVNAAHMKFVRSLRESYVRRTQSSSSLSYFVKNRSNERAIEAVVDGNIENSRLLEYKMLFEQPKKLFAEWRRDKKMSQLNDADRIIFAEGARRFLSLTDDVEAQLETMVDIIIWHPTIFREFENNVLAEIIVENLSRWKSSIAAAIFLHRYIQFSGKTRLESKLQLLVKWLLDADVTADCFGKGRDAEVIYFIKVVCIQSNLTLLASVQRASDRRRERMALCRKLIDLDADNSNVYEEEIRDLTLDGLKEDALHSFDQSRVFVNVAGLIDVALSDFTEAFERVKDLSAIPEGMAAVPANVLRDLVPASKDGKEVIEQQRGVSEVKQIFLDMLNGLASMYLNNPTHGLDSFLSLRIRHGSMASSIRGPLEEAYLITSYGRSLLVSDYESNEHWLDLFGEDRLQRARLDIILREFSKHADGLINNTINEFVQIYGKDHPLGVFKIAISEERIADLMAKGVIAPGPKDFFEYCFKTFAFVISPCLDSIRAIIDKDMKSQFDLLLIKLAADVEVEVGSERALAFNHAVNQTRITLQQAADRVIGWFHLRDSVGSTTTYTLEELVSVCVAIARNTHAGFNPNVITEISENDRRLRVMGQMLHPFSDAVFIMMDNVYKHSGVNPPPDITLKIKLNESKALQVRCESPVFDSLEIRNSKAERVEKIRDQISNFSPNSSVNLEGGTGLLKLRKLADGVSIDGARPAIDFGYFDGDYFFVTVNLPVHVRGRSED